MFKKKPNVRDKCCQTPNNPADRSVSIQIKPLAPLRSSDRRKTADQIIKDLNIALPSHDASDDASVAAARTALRNALLPDNALSARFTTTQGPELRPVSGTVYVGGADQRVLWISVEGITYPSVYTLWKNPSIVPLLHCGTSVVTRLQGGADLMIPGLIYGPPFPENAKKGAVVAIAGHEKASVPVVVGRCLIDVAGLKDVRGVKGVAVEVFHWLGDEIWSWGKQGGEMPEEIVGWVSSGVDELAYETADPGIEEDEGGVALPSSTNDGARPAPTQDDDPPEPQKEYSTAELDTIFLNAFLYALNHYKSLNPSHKTHGLDFPLTQTFVIASMLNPFLPTFTPSDTQQMTIKKTSWKNVRKFIKYLDKRRIVKSKDRDGNEAVVLDVDFDEQSVLAFKPYRLPKRETASGPSAGSTDEGDGSDPSIGQNLKVQSLFKPKDKLLSLFPNTPEGPKPFITSAEVKSAVMAYIERESLILPNNKRILKLDPFLANSVLDSGSALDKEALAKGSIPRDVLADRVLASCAPFHIILRNNASPADAKPKAGSPPKIQVTLETRSGNKTATKISGVEVYHIPPQPLADELRKTCAGSTSVERLQGSSPKAPVMEVMVQGPQSAAVLKALERRGVDKRWVDVVDKTKGKGKR